MTKFISTTLIFAVFTTLAFSQNLTQTVRGTIIDSDNKLPLIGATVIIIGTDPLIGTATDVNGIFRFDNIPLGRIAVKISYLGYETKTISDIVVNSGKEVVLDLTMQESVTKIDEVIVKAYKKKGEAINDMSQLSTHSITLEETKRFTGGMDDPARVVSSYAGVTSSDASSDIIVRGNSPKYMQWRLDGAEISSPYHMDDQNSSFGALTALNNNLLATSDFYTGAFSSEYGDVLSCVYDVKLRSGNNEKFEATRGIGLMGTELTLEGPLKKGYAGSYLFNYRYSSISLINDIGLINVPGVVNYQDATFKVVLPTKRTGTFSFYGLGGLSGFTMDNMGPTDLSTPGRTTSIDQLSQWFLNQNSRISTVNINDVKRLDDSCYYLIIGLTGKLKDLSVFDLPIKINNNKFALGTMELTDNDDAITIINEKAQCSAVIGNSYAALRNMSSGRFLGLYDYYILKKNKMSYMGNFQENKFIPESLVDLALIRKENYSRKIDNEFIEACFSCKYNTISQFQVTIDSLIDLFNDFCKLYKVKKPSQKLKFFIHADQSEINIVSGDPKPGTTGGFVIDSMIHTVGIDKELLTHEGVHFIFNSNSRSHNAFFNEGIPLSFALFQHPERIANDCNLIKDNLEIQDLITGKTEFWKGPYRNGQCLSYPISGLFIKFLIDKYGIDKLKRFYQYPDVTKGFKTIYNMELPMVVMEWKNFVMSNIN